MLILNNVKSKSKNLAYVKVKPALSLLFVSLPLSQKSCMELYYQVDMKKFFINSTFCLRTFL